MTSKLTRERLQEIAEDGFLKHGESKELARMALAAMDSESVGTLSVRHMSYSGKKIGNQFGFIHSDAAMTIAEGDYPLYRHAQPVPVVSADLLHSAASAIEDLLTTKDRTGAGVWFDLPFKLRSAANAQPVPERDQVRSEHAEWSQATFGNVGPVGPLKHLSKEALEAAAEPGDLSEWADMQFLLWDAQRRAGITDEQITQAMIDKLAVNKQRSWPEPKDGEPRLHIKEQPAPVVLDAIDTNLIEALRLVQCMLDDYRERNYGDAQGWIRHINTHMSDYTEAHGDDAYSVLHNLITASPQLPGSEPSAVPGKWIPVSERMPEDRTQVILWDAEIGEVTSGHYSHKTQTFYHCGDAIENEITHWMLPPSAPQGVKP